MQAKKTPNATAVIYPEEADGDYKQTAGITEKA